MLTLTHSIYTEVSAGKYSVFSASTIMHLSEYLCYNHLRTKHLR